jgi:hypothetical protein
MRSPLALAPPVRVAGFAATLLVLSLPESSRAQSCTPVALSDGVVVTLPFESRLWTSFPGSSSWVVVGIQGAWIGDWDLYGYAHSDVQAPPDCYGVPEGRSVAQPPWCYVIGWNFAGGTLPPGTYIAEVRAYEAGGSPKVELDATPVAMVVNGPPLAVPASSTNLVELWEIDLVAGNSYTVIVDPDGPPEQEAANVHLLSPQTALASTAPGARFSPAGGTYVAPVTGRYAVVGTSPTSLGLGYSVQITGANVDAGILPAGNVARIVGLAPNPSFGAARLSFDVPAAGEVVVRVVDLAGRRRAATTWRAAAAGRQHLELADLADGRVAAGVYFVSLEFGGRKSAAARFVVLPGPP